MNEASESTAGAKAQETAQASATAMYQRDLAAHAMGIEVAEVRPGYARVTMTVRPEMVNGHAIAHGAYVFGLADTAFAYACNSRNQTNVALQCSISFVAPARSGDRLIAIAEEQTRSNRTGVFDVRVVHEHGDKPIAYFRGIPYRLDATLY